MKATPRPQTRSAPFGFNVIGFVSTNSGLGIAARNTIRTLLDRGQNVAVLDIETGSRASNRDATYLHLQWPVEQRAPYSVNLFHLNPLEILRLVGGNPPWLDMVSRLNVCVPFWELPRVPRVWLPVLRRMDLVLAPTRYIFEALAADLTTTPIIHYPQSVQIPTGIAPDRARWGLPQERVVFAMSFDSQSDIERKNPWAAIDAFSRLEPSKNGAHLMIKLGVSNDKGRNPLETRLRKLVGSDQSVTVIQQDLEYPDLLSLYASCDAFVSLHRAEGLGLVLMEAMSLGKPVVTTGWSGNMDFTNPRNACLVPYRLIPVQGTTAHAYSRLQIWHKVCWADPDTTSAAALMQRILEEPRFREQLGESGRSSMLRMADLAAQTPWLPRVASASGAIVAAQAGNRPWTRSRTEVELRYLGRIFRAVRNAARSMRHPQSECLSGHPIGGGLE